MTACSPGFDGCFDPYRRGRLAAEERTHAVPHAADVLFQDAEELPGADEVLPAGKDFAAQEGSVPCGLQNPGHGVLIGGADIPGQDFRGLLLFLRGLGEGRDAPAERAHGAVQRPPGNLGPPRRICRQFAQPPPQGFHGFGGQHSEAVEGDLPDNEQPRCAEAFLLQHRPEVRAHLRLRGRRHPVQHHGHHDVPGGGVEEQLPGDGVSIAVGCCDKYPEVGGREQLSGELPVVIRDRVDVRSIQQRNPFRHRRMPHQHQGRYGGGIRCGAGAAGWHRSVHHSTPDTAQARQHALVFEPACVSRIVQQDRLPGGWADGTGPRDGVAHEGIHEGGFPGTGGSAHDRQQRSVQAAETRKDVVIQLRQRIPDIKAGGVRSRQRERQHGRAEVAADSLEQVHGSSSP